MHCRPAMTGTRSVRRVVVSLSLIALAGLLYSLNGSRASAAERSPEAFVKGDVIVGSPDQTGSKIQRFSPTGVLLQTFKPMDNCHSARGMAFDRNGNLYGTVFYCGKVLRFDVNFNLMGPFGNGLSPFPESVVIDTAQNVYVGQAQNQFAPPGQQPGPILKFGPAGNLLATYSPPTATDWIDLSSDQCTMLYTSEDTSIRRFDVCKNSQLPAFCSGCGSTLYAIRIRPNGDVLAADGGAGLVRRFNSSGSPIQTYSAEGLTQPFALALDPDGQSFWTGDVRIPFKVFRFDIGTGSVITQFGTTDSVAGLAVVSESIAPPITPTFTRTATPPPTPTPTPSQPGLPAPSTAYVVSGATVNIFNGRYGGNTGVPITFTATETHASSYRWDFGDGTSATGKSATKSYTTAGSYRVVLTVTGDGTNTSGTSSTQINLDITGPPSVTPTPTPPPFFSLTLPVVAHTVGQGGAIFLTDVELGNPNAFPVTATLSFNPGGPPVQRTVTLASLETRSINDVVATVFGTTGLGAMRIETAGVGGQGAPALLATSRTYIQTADGGTSGLSIPGQADAAAQPLPVYVTGIQQNADFRTNLGGFNLEPNATENFFIVLRGPDGSIAGTSSPIALAPFSQFQQRITDLFPGVFPSSTSGEGLKTSRALAGTGFTAEYRPIGSSNVPLGYGAIADNHSGDLTYFSAARPSTTWFLPIFSRVAGQGGVLFKTRLALSNSSTATSDVTLTFLERGRDPASQPPTFSLTLAPGQPATFDDAGQDLFGISNSLGAIIIAATQPLNVTEKIYSDTQSGGSPGTIGMQADPSRPDQLDSRPYITLPPQDLRSRANLGLFNPNDSSVSVSMILRGADGGQLGSTRTILLSPKSMIYSRLADFFPDAVLTPGDRRPPRVDLTASNKIASFGIIADNVSQDLTFVPGASGDPRSKPLSTLPAKPASKGAEGQVRSALVGMVAAGLWILRQLVS